MCKLFIQIGIKQDAETAELARKINAQAIEQMIKSGEKDGAGYMEVGTRGIYFEKWSRGVEIGKPCLVTNSPYPELEDTVYQIPSVYATGGERSDFPFSIAGHTRTATSGGGVENSHPFVRLDKMTGIIHNGVISNHEKIKKVLSSCDSEAILTSFIGAGIHTEISQKRIDALIEKLEGSMGVCAFSNGGVDIFRNTGGNLNIASSPLGGFIVATSPGTIKATVKNHGPIAEMVPNKWIRFNFGGRVVGLFKLKDKPPERWATPAYLGKQYCQTFEEDTRYPTYPGEIEYPYKY